MHYTNFDLRTIIQEKGITFRQLAEYFDVTPTTFTRWMNKELDREKRMKIITAVHVLSSDQALSKKEARENG